MPGIKDLIDNPHWIYKRYLNYWNFLLESYEGGVDYTRSDLQRTSLNERGIIEIKVEGKPLESKVRTNLFKHKKERYADYEERVNMSYYYNFCAPIIDIYTNHLFKDPIIDKWDNIQSAIDQTGENIDRKGSNINEFRHGMAELAQIYGHIYVLVDKPKMQTEIASLAHQMEAGMFPYLTFFHPHDVINWAVDEFGQPYWVLLRESMDGNIDAMNYDPKKMTVKRYRIWTRQEWILFDESFQEVERGTHNVGKVPISIIYNKPSKKCRNFLGISELADIAFIARDVYNKCSELNEIIRNQTFSILAIQGKSNEYNELSVGTSKALLYPEDRNVPQYVSPPPQNAEILMKQIEGQVHKMFQLAKLEGGSAQQVTQVQSQSGVSKAFDFQETNSALAKKASHMEDGETRIWNLVARWEGQTGFEGSISYPRNFDISELNDDLDEAEKLFRMQLGREFDIQLKKDIVKKKFPRLPDDEMDKIIDEIKNKEGQTEGTNLRSRLSGFFNNNATPGGIKRGGNNGGRTTTAGPAESTGQ